MEDIKLKKDKSTIEQFGGFPTKMRFTPVPNLFFSSLLLQINDVIELKVTLFIIWALYQKRGYPRFVAYRELLDNGNLMRSLKRLGGTSDETLRRALEMAVRRGTILHLALEGNRATEDIYLLNTKADRQVMAKIQSGELVLGNLKAGRPAEAEAEELPDLFTLYEQNMGMLTPMIAEELREAEKLYPESWIRDAIKEAVSSNKRNIKYILRILERWSAEGKSDGTYRRDSKADPNKYAKQKYGHMVRR